MPCQKSPACRPSEFLQSRTHLFVPWRKIPLAFRNIPQWRGSRHRILCRLDVCATAGVMRRLDSSDGASADEYAGRVSCARSPTRASVPRRTWAEEGRPSMEAEMLVDEFLRVYDVSETVATIVAADAAIAWRALMDVDLIEVGRRRPLVAALSTLRIVPGVVARLLHGDVSPPPRQLRLRDLTALPPDQGGWILLGDRDRDEIA